MDEKAFALLIEPHRRSLHLHCYRMLGSLHDADDALQETMLRAWRGSDRYEPRAQLGTWLHTIATNVCLTAIARRRTQPVQLMEERVLLPRAGLHLLPTRAEHVLAPVDQPLRVPQSVLVDRVGGHARAKYSASTRLDGRLIRPDRNEHLADRSALDGSVCGGRVFEVEAVKR
jgi:RNA polymerase sigma factor (sigma-70 family)